jgi:arylsulfatase A-like enzyme
VDKYKADDIVLPPSFRDMMDDKPRIYQRMRYQYWSQLSKQEVKQSIAHYWAKLSMQDALFGELLDAADFAPTFLDAAGIASSGKQMSGSSLLPWLRNERPTGWRDAIFSQMNGVELYYTQRIVMTDSYKYIYNGFDYDELYDLKKDPHETVNLAFPDLMANRERVQKENGSGMDANTPWPPLPDDLEDIRREMLKKMWNFAREHKDQLFDSYLTTAMAPIGPALAF